MGIRLGAGWWIPGVLDPHTRAAAREQHGQTRPSDPSYSPGTGGSEMVHNAALNLPAWLTCFS